MSNAKHTPGPWIIPKSPDFHNHPFHVQDDNGYAICDMAAEYSSINEDAEHEANARLISAAPELLEYAQLEEARTLPNDMAVVVLEAHGWKHSEMTAIEFMDMKRRAAIAKARGD